MLNIPKQKKTRRGIKVRRVDKPSYTVDNSVLDRYDQKNLIFNRISMDPNWPGYQRTEKEQALKNIAENKTGYTRVDYALKETAWTLLDVWTDAYNWERLEPSSPSPKLGRLLGEEWYREKYPIEDVGEMTRQVKRAARFYGADLVGVTEVDQRWIYANRQADLKPLELPEGVKYAVVMAIEMDEVGVSTSPKVPAAAVTALGYSKMAFVSSSLAEFIRNLGYTAVPTGNDVGLSIPLAVDAGLGQIGRIGLLITPEYGPRVQLCKVFTDLPLEPDKPIDFGVTEFCRHCKRCAEACEVGAISKETEPGWEPACSSSNPGALKWYVDGEKCYQYWVANGADCSTCISACPHSTSGIVQGLLKKKGTQGTPQGEGNPSLPLRLLARDRSKT